MTKKQDRYFCDTCHDRIFRYGYEINGKLYCNTCMNKAFLVTFDRNAYILKEDSKTNPEGKDQ